MAASHRRNHLFDIHDSALVHCGAVSGAPGTGTPGTAMHANIRNGFAAGKNWTARRIGVWMSAPAHGGTQTWEHGLPKLDGWKRW
jgi:hypothetical protein